MLFLFSSAPTVLQKTSNQLTTNDKTYTG